MNRRMGELLDIVDEQGNPTGETAAASVASGDMFVQEDGQGNIVGTVSTYNFIRLMLRFGWNVLDDFNFDGDNPPDLGMR